MLLCLLPSLQGELGDDYRLYLLEDTEEKPVAVVLPLAAVQPVPPPVNEVRPGLHSRGFTRLESSPLAACMPC